VVSAAVVDAANAQTWHVDGVAVPVEPPSWDIGTSNALLSAHIVAHNSFVSARGPRLGQSDHQGHDVRPRSQASAWNQPRRGSQRR